MKVQYKSEERFPFEKWYVWYRKDLSDMPWWKRLFISNPWHLVLLNSREANEIAEKYKTVEELEEFLSEEKSNADWKF